MITSPNSNISKLLTLTLAVAESSKRKVIIFPEPKSVTHVLLIIRFVIPPKIINLPSTGPNDDVSVIKADW